MRHDARTYTPERPRRVNEIVDEREHPKIALKQTFPYLYDGTSNGDPKLLVANNSPSAVN